MFIPCSSVDLQDCSQYTLFLPSSSVQNVGQLAMDLLISTLDCQLVGYWHHSCLLPMVGHDVCSDQQSNVSLNCHNRLITPSQVYMSREHKFLFMQIRSPVVAGGTTTFCADLAKWISQKGFQRVVLATSCHIHEKIDTSIGRGFRYLITHAASGMRDRLENDLSWVPLEECPPTIDGMVDDNESDKILIAGGGFAKIFFLECNKENIPLVVLISLCTEGNAIEKASQLDSHLINWLQFLPGQQSVDVEHGFRAPWIMPKSWESLLNRPVPTDLY